MRSLLFAAAAVLALPALPAFADTYAVTSTGAGINFSATLVGVTDPFNSSAVDFISGSATLNGTTMTLYTPGGTSQAYQIAIFGSPQYTYNTIYEYDNVGYSTSAGLVVDEFGLLFGDSTDHFNIFTENGLPAYTDDETTYGLYHDLDTWSMVDLTPAAATTPEPSAFALLGTGLLALGGLRRRSAGRSRA